MEIRKFNMMLNDRHFCDFRKLQYKYPEDMNDFIETLKEMYFREIPVSDFDGNPVSFIECKADVNMNSYRMLLISQGKAYSPKAVEEEIISTAMIEKIDYSRESVRNILKGYAPNDDAENRIYGMKKGFDFISDKSNAITEENIFRLYQMAVGDFLDESDKLKSGKHYRHDSVHIQDESGNIAHFGISHKKLPKVMAELVSFINADDGMNDLVKASVIHFLFAYYHPYFDGNGRMARLIHLWFLIQKGFGNTLFIPFSSYIVRSLKKYYEAYSLVESNQKLTGVLDVTPFIQYFSENVYNRFEEDELSEDVNESFRQQVRSGSITEKEEKLWQFVIANYGTDEFSTKQLEKDFGNAAYATIRSFVLKFEEMNLLSSRHFSNRVKYRINENNKP